MILEILAVIVLAPIVWLAIQFRIGWNGGMEVVANVDWLLESKIDDWPHLSLHHLGELERLVGLVKTGVCENIAVWRFLDKHPAIDSQITAYRRMAAS